MSADDFVTNLKIRSIKFSRTVCMQGTDFSDKFYAVLIMDCTHKPKFVFLLVMPQKLKTKINYFLVGKQLNIRFMLVGVV